MKPIKATCLAVTAALLAIALVGAGSASATGLCSKSPELVGGGLTKCKAGTAYAAGQEYKATATTAVLENEFENITCATSQATLKAGSNTSPGVDLVGEVTAASFSGCKSSGGFNCTVQSLNKPYKASLSSETGLLTVTGKSGEPSASVSCSVLSCVFGNTAIEFLVESGNPAVARTENFPLKMTKKEGFLVCPASATWTATYVATNPTSVWVSDS